MDRIASHASLSARLQVYEAYFESAQRIVSNWLSITIHPILLGKGIQSEWVHKVTDKQVLRYTQ